MRLFLMLVLMAVSGCVSDGPPPDNDGFPRRPSWAGNN
jgi:hypothetical protein